MANRKLSSVSTKNVCRRDGDVLLRTTTLKDELHTRVPLLVKTKRTSVVLPYTLRLMGSSVRICVPFTDVVQKMHFHIQQ